MEGGYAHRGLVGLLTQANPAAEPEMSTLLGPDITMLTARLTDTAPAMLDRLQAYGERIGDVLATFADAPLAAVAFACTGSTYVYEDRGRDLEAALAARPGPPVLSAAGAIAASLVELGARKIAVVSPYPDDLTGLALTYWSRRGYAVTELARVAVERGDHPIYGLRPGAVARTLAELGVGHDAVLIMGTGAPTLPALDAADPLGPPVLSSNYCLAAATLKRLGGPGLAEVAAPDAAWRTRLRTAYPAAVRDCAAAL